MASNAARFRILGRSALTPPRVPVLTAHVRLWINASGRGSSTASAVDDASGSITITKVVDDAGVLLPKQAILHNFVHHNPHENLQNMNFFTALRLVQELHNIMSPGERLLHVVGVDPRLRTNEAMAELGAVFLDRGASKWAAPHREKGFLYVFAYLEGLGVAPWRKHARQAALDILAHTEQHPDESSVALAESILKENLEFFGSSPEQWIDTTRALLLDLPGWAGMFQRMEEHPVEAPHGVKVQLLEYIAVYSTIARSSIAHLASQSGWDPTMPFGDFLEQAPTIREDSHAELQNPSALAYIDQNFAKRDALEKEYEAYTLNAIGEPEAKPKKTRPVLQLYTCIDEREESFRRHAEEASGNPGEIETFGIPGFMGFQINYKPKCGFEDTILAPEGVKPVLDFVEETPKDQEPTALSYYDRRQLMARIKLAWENASFSPAWSLLSSALFPYTLGKLTVMSFLPNTTRSLMEKYDIQPLNVADKPQTQFELPCSAAEAAKLLTIQFKNVGVQDRFAPIVMLLGHGSRSVNNPFDAAHNCGACGGREGGPNARLMARAANDPKVRENLHWDYNISIPEDTWFVGGYHDTTSEVVELYDTDTMPESHSEKFSQVMKIIKTARGQNALERCQRFMLADVKTEDEALQHVHTRSTDLGEARPELGHATNASVIIGRRELTKGQFLSRRAFLPSYDPFNDDDDGTNLEQVLTPALIVCSGISLEYLFSTTDGGAGTKVPMNLVGHFGVQQGASGDLLHGLPTQMTEMHPAVRALYFIDAPVDRVKAVLGRREALRQIVHNDWIRLVVRDPYTKQLYRQAQGEYIPIGVTAEGEVPTYVSFDHHTVYGHMITQKEFLFAGSAAALMIGSMGLPFYTGLEAMHPHGQLVAAGGTMLSLCALGFGRRYMHGEFMFGRLALLAAGLTSGFNIVATAPDLMHVLGGWGLMGLSSTFLLGAYNDRATARENAPKVFSAYQLSDAALLVGTAFSAHHANLHLAEFMGSGAMESHAGIAAASLTMAALIKSSQFPFAGLFVRSMEGATPTSAMGSGGLSAHAGIVLLSATTPLWFGFDWARLFVGGVGAVTAVQAGLVAQIRADRKGALASATSATLGSLYILLASGYTDAALILSLGHAALRESQFLRSANFILDADNLRADLGNLGSRMEPKSVSERWYKLGWVCNRINTDLSLPHLWHRFKTNTGKTNSAPLTKYQQWSLTGLIVGVVSAPFTPLAHAREETFMEMLHVEPVLAGALMAIHMAVSVALVRTVFTRVLDNDRFRHEEVKPAPFPPIQVENQPLPEASQDDPDREQVPYVHESSWSLPEGSWQVPDHVEGSWQVPDDLDMDDFEDDSDDEEEEEEE